MKKNILKILAVAIIALNLSAATALAEDPKPAAPASPSVLTPIPKPNTLPGPISLDQRKSLVQGTLPKIGVLMIGTTASFSLLFLIIAGVRFATAYGNDEAVQKAKKQAIYAIAGLLVALFAYTIVTIVSNFKYDEGAPATTPSMQNDNSTE